MTTVAARKFRSSPYRDSAETWDAIVELLSGEKSTSARSELLAVSGIAASIIADQSPKDHSITVTCDGPRTRIYCLYDEDAIDESEAREDSLGYDALQGDWALSFPCQASDLAWVQSALKKHSSRITARNLDDEIAADAKTESAASSLTLDVKGFLGS